MKLNDRHETLELDSEQKVNWKVIGAVIAVLLLGVTGFAYQDFMAKRILYIRADDLSESGLEHQAVEIEHCKESQRNQMVGDYSVVIGFADNAEVINEHKIENQLDFTNCEFDTSAFGKLSGTSVLDLFRLANTVVKGYRARGVDYPLVFTLTLDAAEQVPGEPPFNEKSLEEVTEIANMLTKNGQIAIIGPSTTLQQRLKERLEGNPKIRVCPYSNVQQCTEEAIKNARQQVNYSFNDLKPINLGGFK
jgi:hypothetical protein